MTRNQIWRAVQLALQAQNCKHYLGFAPGEVKDHAVRVADEVVTGKWGDDVIEATMNALSDLVFIRQRELRATITPFLL